MKYYFTLLVLFLAFHVIAQQKVDFSGNWVINKDSTAFGNAPQWILPKSFTINQATNHLTIKRVTLDDSLREHSFTENFSYDGSTASTLLNTGVKRTAYLNWNKDGQSFVINSSSVGKDETPQSKIIEIWTEESSGRLLIVNRTVEQPNGLKFTIKAFYNKQ